MPSSHPRVRSLLLAAGALVALATDARADATLARGGVLSFPADIDVDVGVRAQVESTTYVFTFPPITDAGAYSLTVPSPPGGWPIAVDVDRGEGFAPLPVEAEAPAPPSGGAADPALAAWHGTTPLVAELADVAPGPLAVRVRFVRLLRRVAGEVAFDVGVRRCPARAAYDPGAVVHLRARVDTARDLASFTVTGGTATALDRELRAATITSGGARLAGEELVHLRYRELSSGIHAQWIAHRTPAADPMGGTAGYFLLLLDADDLGAGQPRTISLVVDRSGSMAGGKIVQAREAARVMLDHLEPEDRFALHAFDDGLISFRGAPVDASEGNLAAARAWIEGITDRGATDIDRGLAAGLAAPLEADRFDATLLLSDGMATSGEVDDRRILTNATTRAAGRSRIFTVSVGYDADYALMEALARHNRGRHLDLNDAQATRELAARVRDLFEDIHAVRLRDVEVDVLGVGAEDQLPEQPPDLFAGGQLAIVGRYRTPGVAEVRLVGQEGARPFDRVDTFAAPALVATDEVIRHVWATEKVRALMAELAAGGDENAIRAAVIALGVAYRIQTPFTRYAGPVDDPAVAIGGSTACAAGGGATSGWLALGLAIAALARRRRRGARAQ